MESRKGNYLYIDNIKIGETSGISENNIQRGQIEIYPILPEILLLRLSLIRQVR
jgi:hypothetical protein